MLTKTQLSVLGYASGTAALALFLLTGYLVATPEKTAKDSKFTPDSSLISVTAKFSKDPIEPIRPTAVLESSSAESMKIALGEKLFHEKRLDKNNKISCANCHNLKYGGADRLSFSINARGKLTKYNTPTIFNVSLNYKYYWSGKFSSLEDQLNDALKEINSDWPTVLKTLNEIPQYKKDFQQVYQDGVTMDNIKDAFIHYELSLVTPNSRFDQYLAGNSAALSEKEKSGFDLFKNYGCITCHQGTNMGGNFLLKRGKLVRATILNKSGHLLNRDLKHIRVPTLRNIARTAPYFHDGSARSLEDAVKQMSENYVGIPIAEQEIHQIVAFLKTLTGEYKGKSL